MSLTFHYHPLASYCWKVLVALYENDTPFVPKIVDLADEAERAAFLALSPIGKMPVLEDTARGAVVPETSVIIEYLDIHYPGSLRYIPADPDAALKTRLLDRFFDCYVQEPMQKIVLDNLRPAGKTDPHGVAEARAQLVSRYAFLERELAARPWAVGETFGLADCAAMPALYYANRVQPFEASHPNVAAYLARLRERPSVVRVLAEAEPYFRFFPG